jgi:hypothetical protein
MWADEYLGVAKNSVEVAALRGRIPYVHWSRKKLFCRDDLEYYAHNRERGRWRFLRTIEPVRVERGISGAKQGTRSIAKASLPRNRRLGRATQTSWSKLIPRTRQRVRRRRRTQPARIIAAPGDGEAPSRPKPPLLDQER